MRERTGRPRHTGGHRSVLVYMIARGITITSVLPNGAELRRWPGSSGGKVREDLSCVTARCTQPVSKEQRANDLHFAQKSVPAKPCVTQL